MESHLLECPLQLVACELAHTGCSALVARRDLPLHMKEGIQQHLLSASLLNLQLTRDKIERQDQELKKKDEEMAQQLLEKENEVKERDKQMERDLKKRYLKHTEMVKEKDLKLAEMVAEKDMKYAEMIEQRDLKHTQIIKEKDLKYSEMVNDNKQQLAKKQEEMDVMMAKKDRKITELEKKMYAGVVALKRDVKDSRRTTEEHFAKQDGSLKAVQDQLLQVSIAGVTCHEFTLTEFAKCQASELAGDWNSDPFYSHPGGCCLQLDIETNNALHHRSTHIAAWLRLIKGLTWPVEVEVRLVMLNQLGDHTHYSVTRKVDIRQSSGYCCIYCKPLLPQV